MRACRSAIDPIATNGAHFSYQRIAPATDQGPPLPIRGAEFPRSLFLPRKSLSLSARYYACASALGIWPGLARDWKVRRRKSARLREAIYRNA